VPNAAEDEAIKRLAQQLMYGARDSALPDLVADKPRLELSVRFPPNANANRFSLRAGRAKQNVSSEMLEALLQFGKDFNQRGHPSLSALISLATFTHSWLSLQKYAHTHPHHTHTHTTHSRTTVHTCSPHSRVVFGDVGMRAAATPCWRRSTTTAAWPPTRGSWPPRTYSPPLRIAFRFASLSFALLLT
jgi:hypothetical protein